MTNYEKIKAMSVEEMAEFLDTYIDDCEYCFAKKVCGAEPSCFVTITKWLESEAEEDG